MTLQERSSPQEAGAGKAAWMLIWTGLQTAYAELKKDQMDILKEKDAIITQLRQENRRLLREKEEFLALLGRLAENYRRRTAEDADGLTENKEH